MAIEEIVLGTACIPSRVITLESLLGEGLGSSSGYSVREARI